MYACFSRRNQLTRRNLMIFVLFALQQTFAGAQPLTSHPRLFVRGSDLPTLRSWAVAGNPVYQNGLLPLATGAKADMDSGAIATSANGGPTYVTYPEEMYSELFAFMSLISADQPTRDDYAQRARTLLMYVMNQAVLGASAGQPYRDPAFSVNDRSRWWGEGFPLTVDWIYPYLTTADKATIRTVFLRWIGEDINATDHPLPLGVVNSSVLLQSRQAVRFSGNNYYTAHMRNIGLMAASFDDADDPGNTLRNYLGNATGAWLYVLDNLMRTDAAGGLMPEGFEYSPQTVGYIIQLLLALKSAGLDDPATYGQQAVLTNNPFWDQIIPAYLHSLSPAASSNQDAGQVYLPAWYGDGQDYYAPDLIWTLGPLAVYDRLTSNTARPSQIRWIETNLAPGGPEGFAGRTRNSNFFMNAVYYFLLYDPAAPASGDPRPALETSLFASGLGRILARTSWDTAASWFTYKLSFNQVNHQTSDGNQIEFYRNGEWLTKQRVGYFLDDESSINANTLTLQNSPIQRDPTDYRTIEDQLGSQWAYVSAGDPVAVAQDLTANFVFVTGDSTNLYNSTNEGATDILHASRSVMWIKPDYVVVYDRAASQTANRFKRFWLNLPSLPAISGKVATAVTAGGQSLFVSSLLPAASTLSGSQATVIAGSVANFEPMGYRLEVEATGNPFSARFLHVLQGANAGQAVSAAVLVQSSSGTAYDGVAVAGNAVLFPTNLTDTFAGTTYSVPASATLHRVTGLSPGAVYTVTTQAGGLGVQVRLAAGGTKVADSGGVLEFTVSATPLTAQSITFGQPAAITLPSGGISLTASATSGLAVSFTSNTLPVCTVAGATVTPLGAGTCSITASQAGDGTFAAATPVTRTFTVAATAPCDINADGVTNVADVQLIINEALGVAPAVHDLNRDGAVNVADVQKVINAALGLGCVVP